MKRYLQGLSILLAGTILTTSGIILASAHSNDESTLINLYSEDTNASEQLRSSENIYDIKAVDAVTDDRLSAVSLVDKSYYDHAEKVQKQEIKQSLAEDFNEKKQIVFYGNADNLCEDEILDTIGEKNPINIELTDEQKDALTAIAVTKDFDGGYIMTKYFDYVNENKTDDTISAMLDRVLEDDYSQKTESSSIAPQAIKIDPNAKSNGYKMRYLSRTSIFDVSLYYLWNRRGHDSDHTEWEMKLAPSISMNSKTSYQINSAEVVFNNGTKDEQILKSCPPTTQQSGSVSENVSGSISSKLDASINNGYSYDNNWTSQSIVQRKVDGDANSVQWVVAVKSDTAVSKYGTQFEVGTLIANSHGDCSVRTNFILNVAQYNSRGEVTQLISDKSPLLINIPDIKVSK